MGALISSQGFAYPNTQSVRRTSRTDWWSRLRDEAFDRVYCVRTCIDFIASQTNKDQHYYEKLAKYLIRVLSVLEIQSKTADPVKLLEVQQKTQQLINVCLDDPDALGYLYHHLSPWSVGPPKSITLPRLSQLDLNFGSKIF